MYILKVDTLEYSPEEKGLKKRFEYLKKNIQSKNSIIESMTLFDNRTGEIINEYPRFESTVHNN